MKKKSPPRKTYKFQFRQDREQTLHAQEIIAFWRTKKQCVPNLLNAIELYYALESGDVSVLERLFPKPGQGSKVATEEMPALVISAIDRLTTTLERMNVPVTIEERVSTIVTKVSVPQLSAPVAEVKQGIAVSADSIADNYLSMFA